MKADDTTGIGIRLRAARVRRRWSREQLAVESGISWSAIAQVEAGRRTNLRQNTLTSLSRALGVTVDYLVSGALPAPQMLDHYALLYRDQRQFVDTAAPFLAEAIDHRHPALIVTTEANAAAVRDRLGADAGRVRFEDRASWYTTPAHALSGYQSFVDAVLDAGAPWIRIVGQLDLAGRGPAEVRRWAKYESLLNLVFGQMPASILCVYDLSEADGEIADHACATHSHTLDGRELTARPEFRDPGSFVLQV